MTSAAGASDAAGVQTVSDCPLCTGDGGDVVWRHADLRVIVVRAGAGEVPYPGFCRVIWNAHRAEWSDLDNAGRATLSTALLAVERVVRAHMQCDKINLASLGNMVPHLHWHIIPRFADDAHFPQAIWGAPLREVDAAVLDARARRAAPLPEALREALDAAFGV
jgi:diadenosine tetraphosphate (Ap4A) HIT family hydrolase